MVNLECAFLLEGYGTIAHVYKSNCYFDSVFLAVDSKWVHIILLGTYYTAKFFYGMWELYSHKLAINALLQDRYSSLKRTRSTNSSKLFMLNYQLAHYGTEVMTLPSLYTCTDKLNCL